MHQSGDLKGDLHWHTILSFSLGCLTPRLENAQNYSWDAESFCYRLSKQLNCFCGTCSGLGTWRLRCTRGASSGTRHVVPLPSPPLIALVTVPLNGGASPMMPALSMTPASALAPVPFPQLSPHVPSYRPITPSPCTLGQQVITSLSRLIVLPRLVYLYPGS